MATNNRKQRNAAAQAAASLSTDCLTNDENTVWQIFEKMPKSGGPMNILLLQKPDAKPPYSTASVITLLRRFLESAAADHQPLANKFRAMLAKINPNLPVEFICDHSGVPAKNENSTSDASNRAAIKRGINARVDQIKKQLFNWIHENATPADAVPVTVALLEIAIEGHLIITENADDTLDFVTNVLQRVVHKPTGTVQ